LEEIRTAIGDAMDALRDAMHGNSVRGDGADLTAQRLEVVSTKLASAYEMASAEIEREAAAANQ
jgi:hypothetical protein